MARPREFCEETVLQAAMQAFWKNGYEATSISDLLQATGLTKGSLYKAFHSKHKLFLTALKHYMDQHFAQNIHLLRAEGPAPEVIANWFSAMLDETQVGDCETMGCLAVNTMVEMAPHDPEVGALIDATMQRALGALGDRLRQGQEAGEIRKDFELEDMAMLFAVFNMGTSASSRHILSNERAKHLTRQFVRLMST